MAGGGGGGLGGRGGGGGGAEGGKGGWRSSIGGGSFWFLVGAPSHVPSLP